MAGVYANTEERLKDDAEDPIGKREYGLILLNARDAEFDKGHGTLKNVLDVESNKELDRTSLRTQIISDPTRALSAAERVLQFFFVNPDRESLQSRTQVGIIFEQGDSNEIPLFFLSPDEVWYMAHGEGFSSPLRISV